MTRRQAEEKKQSKTITKKKETKVEKNERSTPLYVTLRHAVALHVETVITGHICRTAGPVSYTLVFSYFGVVGDTDANFFHRLFSPLHFFLLVPSSSSSSLFLHPPALLILTKAIPTDGPTDRPMDGKGLL